MALSIIADILRKYGLESLIPWANGLLVNGASEAEIESTLYDQKAFRDRFWMMFKHQDNGYGAASPAQVLEYENRAREEAKMRGLTVSDQQIGQWFADGKSMVEQAARMDLAQRFAYQTDKTTLTQLQERYGIGMGDITSYWLDGPKALPELQRRYVQADIAGSAVRAGFRPYLSEENLGTLYDRGVTGENAGEAFGKLAQTEELFEAVDQTEQDVSLEDQLKLITGDADVAKTVEQRVGKRRAYFDEGGGFASGKTGVSGLGSAAR
jgi:hypothetical protein